MKLPIKVTDKYKRENVLNVKEQVSAARYRDLHRISWQISSKDIRDNFGPVLHVKHFMEIQTIFL